MNQKTHWESVYATNAPDQVGWFQAHPRLSLEMIVECALSSSAHIIDVGGGASTLVDHLVAQAYANITVLDISGNALVAAQARLGALARDVTWIEADVTKAALPTAAYDLWHDRAVFHFLVDKDDRARYVEVMRKTLKPDGHLIIAAFALDGPTRCSGLETVRFGPEDLCREVGAAFRLVASEYETHMTPSGKHQNYIFCRFRRQS